MVTDPDGTEDHVPAACTGCGQSLGQGDGIGFELHHVRDIPLITVRVTECWAHRCRCACETVTTTTMPEDVAKSPSYGTNLRALAVSVGLTPAPTPTLLEPADLPVRPRRADRDADPGRARGGDLHRLGRLSHRQPVVRSYLGSARKHGLSTFEAIHRAFIGNLGMPPIAQST